MAFNRRVQRTLQALQQSNNMYNTPAPKEDFTDDGELFQHIYDRGRKGAKGTWKGADWDAFENMMKAEGITPANDMKVKVETSFNWQDGRPVSIRQKYIHVIVGTTENGADDIRELYFKGDQKTEIFPQNYEELKAMMEYGAYKPAPEKLIDGNWRTFQWKQSCRFKTAASTSAIDAK